MVQRSSQDIPSREHELVACRHYWIIDAPSGPVSRGVCRECDEVREFKNVIDSAPWGEETSTTQSSGEQYAKVSPSEEQEETEES